MKANANHSLIFAQKDFCLPDIACLPRKKNLMTKNIFVINEGQ